MADTGGDETSGSRGNPEGRMFDQTRTRIRDPNFHHRPLIIKEKVQEDQATANYNQIVQALKVLVESHSQPSHPNTIPMEVDEEPLIPPSPLSQSCREDEQTAGSDEGTSSDKQQTIHFEPVLFPEMTESESIPDWRRDKCLNDIMKYALENDEDTFKDVTFLVGPDQQPISAHRYYLGIISPKFADVFFKHPTLKDERRHLNLLLPDTKPSSFRLLLRYIYVRRVEVDMDEALEVLKLAYRFKISDLVVKCMSQLRTGLNSTNAAEILQVAWGLPDPRLKECALLHIASNPKAVFQTPGFLALELDPVCAVLDSNLNLDEASIFLQVKRWAEHSIRKKNLTEDVKITGEDIRKELGKALFLIRFPLFTGPEFCLHVSNAEILRLEEAYKVLETMVPGYDHSRAAGLPFSSEPRTRRTVVAAASSSTATVRFTGVRSSETTIGFSEPINVGVGVVHGEQLSSQNYGRERECSGGRMGSVERGATETDRHTAATPSRVHPLASEEGGSDQERSAHREDGKRPRKRSKLISDEMDRSGETESTMDIAETPTSPLAHIASADPVPSTSGCNESNDISRRSSDQEVAENSQVCDREEQSQLIQKEVASEEEHDLSFSSITDDDEDYEQEADKKNSPSTLTKMSLRKPQILKLLTPEEENYIKNNMGSENGNNLTNFYSRLKVILEMQDSQQVQVIREDHPPVVIDTAIPMTLEFPFLTDFHVNYLINTQTIQSYKTYVSTLNIIPLLLFRKFETIQDLMELYYMPDRLEGEQDEVNVTIVLNGVTILKVDFREDSLTLSRIDTSIQWIMEGVQKSNEVFPRLKSIHLEECVTSLELLPYQSLENITLREVRGVRNFAGFLQKCKNLREFSCNNIRYESINFGVHLGLLTPEGTKLRRIALRHARVHCYNPTEPLDNKIEELYLDSCLFSPSFIQGFHLIFPNLKKLKIVRNNSVNLILNALKIDSLEWVGVWEPNWKSAMPKKVEGRGKNPHDPAVLEINEVFEDAGFDSSWINSTEKGFILFRQGRNQSQSVPRTTDLSFLILRSETSSSGRTVELLEHVQSSSQAAVVADNPPEMTRRWMGAKIGNKLQEFRRLDYEQFGWAMFYKDYDLFEKLEKEWD